LRSLYLQQLALPEMLVRLRRGCEVVEDYLPDAAFAGREGRKRVRLLSRVGLMRMERTPLFEIDRTHLSRTIC